MGLGGAWGTGYGRELEILARAMEHAARHDRAGLEEFVHRLSSGNEPLTAVHTATLMRGAPPTGCTGAAIEADWFGRGGPSMWKATARQRPSEICQVLRAAQAELGRRLLNSPAKVEILGQCGHDDAEVWITWPEGQAPPPTLTMWVFVPDNSAEGPGRFGSGAKLGSGHAALVEGLRAKIAGRGVANLSLPPSGQPHGIAHPDPLVNEILEAVDALPRGYPVYRELGLSSGPDDGAGAGTVTYSGPHEGHEPAMDQQAPLSRTNPRGQEVRLVRVGWSPGPEPAGGARRVAACSATSA